jgi:hypothetical protein
MTKEDVASFSLYWKEARADFLFREKRIFFFSSLLSLFGDRVEFFFGSIEQRKRDSTSEIWASRIIMKTQKKWNLESLEKARAEKIIEWILFLCTVKNNRQKFVDFALRKSIFFVHADVRLETYWTSLDSKNSTFFMQISEDPVEPSKFPHEHQNEQKNLDFLIANSTNFRPLFFTVQRQKF